MVSIQRVVTPAVMRAQGGGWVVLQGWRREGFLRRDTLQGVDGGHVRLLHITHYKKGKLAHHRACTHANNLHVIALAITGRETIKVTPGRRAPAGG